MSREEQPADPRPILLAACRRPLRDTRRGPLSGFASHLPTAFLSGSGRPASVGAWTPDVLRRCVQSLRVEDDHFDAAEGSASKRVPAYSGELVEGVVDG